MKEETLKQLKEKFKETKNNNKAHNEKVKRLIELKKTRLVQEYLNLLSDLNNQRLVPNNDNDIIATIYAQGLTYNRHETNQIYVYLGTYHRSDEIDIEHKMPDEQVDYDAYNADYRLYQDIEAAEPLTVIMKACEAFESQYTIINPKKAFSKLEFKQLQQEFFKNAILKDQDTAVKKLIKQYNLNR